MFDADFIKQFAAQVAEVVLARMPQQKIEQRYLSVEEAAIYAGYSSEALWKHIQRGALPVSRQGKSVRVDKQEIDRWMIRNRQ
jgi:excisionase family DNA binding protein